MPFTLQQPIREKWPNYVFFKEIFTKEECEKIKSLSKVLGITDAHIGGNSQSGTVDTNIRRSKTGWIHWSQEYDWIFQKLVKTIYDSNITFYGFHLAALNEPIQLTHYHESDKGHYDWHQDLGPGAQSVRKLSLVCLLEDKNNFEGGELELFTNKGPVKELTQGSVIVFPSYEPHRVTALTKGERWSLVLWVSGPPFA